MRLPNNKEDTIVAVATPRGRGGIGIVRVSGGKTPVIAQQILGKLPKPRVAEYRPFLNKEQEPIDQGIALFFKAPHSFTGEDVLELQGHGGPYVLDSLVKLSISLGARLAEPGEFMLRAFLNNKIDLLQAEAVSDLINANSLSAAKGAMRSLQGGFSKLVDSIVEELIRLRMYVEAAIDFPEEEIDFLNDSNIAEQLEQLLEKLNHVNEKAKQGALINDGVNIVIAGRPNAGKSSLLNALADRDSAIVTSIPGTTRDILKETISIDGLCIQFIDTAGLRESSDPIEQEGMRRALKEISLADHLVWVVDVTEAENNISFSDFNLQEINLQQMKKTIFYNKIDKINKAPEIREIAENNKNKETAKVGEIKEIKKTKAIKETKEINKPENLGEYTEIYASAKTGAGLDLFREHIKKTVGFTETIEGTFTARRRHLGSLIEARHCLNEAKRQWLEFKAAELLAEELRQAQLALESITGRFSSDDLLGKIFSEFCIGK